MPWDEPTWLADATEWIDAHVTRTGDVAVERTTLWSGVLRVPTSAGTTWFKESAPPLAFEPALTELVARLGHPFGPTVIAADGARLLTAEAGPSYRDLGGPVPWEEVLRLYSDLQLALVAHAGAALELGVPDKRPGALADAYAGVLLRAEVPRDLLDRLRRLGPRVAELAEEVGDAVPASLAHEEVHEGNIFVGDRIQLLDWGEAAVAHPFTGVVNTFRSVTYDGGVQPGGAEIERLRDVYLEPWTTFAPLAELRRIFTPAYALGCLGRVLLWDTILHGLPPERRHEYDEPIPGWLGIWAAAAEGSGRIGDE